MRYPQYIFVLSLSFVSVFWQEIYSEEIKIQGDNLSIFEKEKKYLISGNVIAEGDDFILFSDKIEMYDKEYSRIMEGNFIILSESLLVDCEKVEIFKKENIRRFYNLNGMVLKLSVNPHNYIHYNKNLIGNTFEYRMRLKTSYLKQIEDNRFYARDVRYTLCNCSENNTWELSSSSLYYEKDTFLLSLSNIVYLYGIPSLYIPAIIVPVGERRSGFLLPEIGFSTTTGYTIKNAYYQTLGVSADSTLYLTLMSRKGEMYSFEFRYRPLENLYGKIIFSFVNDNSDTLYTHRFSLKNEHRLEYSNRLKVGLNTNLVSDSSYMYDFLFDFWERNMEYTLSRFYVVYHKDDILFNFSNDFYQNFKQGLKIEDFNFFSDVALAESQRLPSFSFTILPQSLFLNTDFMFEVNYVNYYSFSYDYKKVNYYGNPMIISDDKRALLSFQRFTLGLPVHNYLQFGDILNVNQSIYPIFRRYQLPNNSFNLATSLYDINLNIELFKNYSFFLHILAPLLEYKNLFYLEYTKDNKIYYGRVVSKDEKDNYTKAQQIMIHLGNYFYKRNSDKYQEVVSIDIAQGYQEIERIKLTPAIINTDVSTNYLRLSGHLFYFWEESNPYFDSVVNMSISDKRGDSVAIRYQKIKNYLENPLVVFNEEFGYLMPAFYKRGLNDIFLSASILLLRELSLSYFITYSFEQERLVYHGTGLYYHSRCNCLNAGITFIMYDWYEFPSFVTSLNLGGNI